MSVRIGAMAVLGCLFLPGVEAGNVEESQAEVAPPAGLVEFQGDLHVDHPLVGQFWSPAKEAFVGWEQVVERLPAGGWLMIGEQHDHPDHHRLETFFIDWLAGQGRLGVVAMEMIAADQQVAMDRWLGWVETPSGEDLDWPADGWPWTDYAAQVTTALRQAERVVAGDLSREQKRALQGGDARPPRYSEDHTAFLAELVVESHCNLFPVERAGPMVDMQLARDRFMAGQLEQYAVAGRVGVFIAGANHVRADFGVPVWLDVDLPHLVLILMAVDEEDDPAAYLDHRFDDRTPADLVYFVPGIEQPDYCERLRQRIQAG